MTATNAHSNRERQRTYPLDWDDPYCNARPKSSHGFAPRPRCPMLSSKNSVTAALRLILANAITNVGGPRRACRRPRVPAYPSVVCLLSTSQLYHWPLAGNCTALAPRCGLAIDFSSENTPRFKCMSVGSTRSPSSGLCRPIAVITFENCAIRPPSSCTARVILSMLSRYSDYHLVWKMSSCSMLPYIEGGFQHAASTKRQSPRPQRPTRS